jgi:hypothetical protein
LISPRQRVACPLPQEELTDSPKTTSFTVKGCQKEVGEGQGRSGPGVREGTTAREVRVEGLTVA